MYLEVSNVKKSYGTGDGRQEILKSVNLSMERGATASIIGSSGCCKSTLLNCIGALEVIDDGDIRIDGKSLKGLGQKERGVYRRDNIGYIFQFFNLFARALIKNPRLLLCDEPTGALDSATAKDTLVLLEKVNEAFGTTILLVTHNQVILYAWT